MRQQTKRSVRGSQGFGMRVLIGLEAAVAAGLVVLAGGCSSLYTSTDTLTTESTTPAEAAAAERKARPLSLDERASAVPMQAEQFATLGYRVDWRGFATVLPGESGALFELLGDALAFQDTGGALTVLEARSGQQRWSDQPANTLTRFVGINRASGFGGGSTGVIMLSSESELFVYDAATGTLKDKQRLGEVVNTAPVIVGPMAVYGSASGRGLGHLFANGFKAWSSGLGGSIEEAPVLMGQTGDVAMVSKSGDIAIVSGESGYGRGRAKIYAGPGAPLAASGTLVYVASVDHSLYAFGADGQMAWRHRTDAPLRKRPVYHDNRVYCDLGEAGGMSAFDAASGKLLWSNKDAHGEIIAMRKGKLVGFDGTKGYTLEPKKGLMVDSVELTNIGGFKGEAFADGVLYAVSPLGVITRLVPR